MSVKPQIFQQTKQTILKNKKQFIEIQLTQLSKRIGNLKNQNNNLKVQIKQLKSKPTKKLTICQSSCKDDIRNLNKQNQVNNKNRVIQFQCDSQRIFINGKGMYLGDEAEEELTEYENRLQEQQKNKQKQLQNLQSQIIQLKKIWQNKQQQKKNEKYSLPFKSNQDQITQRISREHKNTKLSYKINQFSQSIDSYDESQTDNQNKMMNLNNSGYMNMSQEPSQFLNINFGQSNQMAQTRRKTMSLSLNNETVNSNQGFNFGKKANNRVKPNIQQFSISKISPNTDRDVFTNNQSRTSTTSFLVTNKLSKPTNSISKSNLTTLNNSLSHSNSRTSMSYVSSKSNLKRSQASKSYAKIVTKLMCCGCKLQYRPNQYYAHIQQCREYIKIKLTEQKQKIDQQINQTLNLSVGYI